MKHMTLTEAQVGSLLVLYDHGAVDQERAKRLDELGLERGDVKRLRDFGLMQNVRLSLYGGAMVYWLSDRGIERARAEKRAVAA